MPIIFLYTYIISKKRHILINGGYLRMITVSELKKALNDIHEFTSRYHYRPTKKTIRIKGVQISCDFSLWKKNAKTLTYIIDVEKGEFVPYIGKTTRYSKTLCGFFQEPKLILGLDTFLDHISIPSAWEAIILHECGHYLLQSAYLIYTGEILRRWFDPGVLHQVINAYHRTASYANLPSENQTSLVRLLDLTANWYHQRIAKMQKECSSRGIYTGNGTRSMIWEVIRKVVRQELESYKNSESVEYYLTHASNSIMIEDELEAELFAIANFSKESAKGFDKVLEILQDSIRIAKNQKENLSKKDFSEKFLDGYMFFLDLYGKMLKNIVDTIGSDVIMEFYEI